MQNTAALTASDLRPSVTITTAELEVIVSRHLGISVTIADLWTTNYGHHVELVAKTPYEIELASVLAR